MEPLSREVLMANGKCCGNGCTNCPYFEKHKKGSTLVNTKQEVKR